MNAAVLTGPEKIEIREIPVPNVKSNEVLVRIKNCGICTLEQRLFRGDMKIFYPIIPGHEAAGEIMEIGKDVIGDLKIGDPAALDLVTRCGECFFCRTGRSNMCENRFKKGQQVLGGFGEYIAVKATQVYPLPGTLSYPEASFVEPTACCIRSLKKTGLTIGEDLLIFGAGTMGLLHLQAANCFGARVFISDPNQHRLEDASRLGAYKTINPETESLVDIMRSETGGRGADTVVITTPAPEVLDSAVEAAAETGRINIYTSYVENLPLPLNANTLHRREYTVTGSEGRTEIDFCQALRVLGARKINVNPLISKTVAFSEINEGFRAAMGDDTYRVLLCQK